MSYWPLNISFAHFEGFLAVFLNFLKKIFTLTQDEWLRTLRPSPNLWFGTIVWKKMRNFWFFWCFYQKTKIRCKNWAYFPTLKIHNSWSVGPTSWRISLKHYIFSPGTKKNLCNEKKRCYLSKSPNVAFCSFLGVQIQAVTDKRCN